MSDDPKAISRSLVALLGTASGGRFSSCDLLETTIPRLTEIVVLDMFDTSLKNEAIEVIEAMCAAESAATRKFFQAFAESGGTKVRLFEYLLKTLFVPELYLSPVTNILSSFVNWTSSAYRIVVVDNGYLDILIRLLTDEKLILQDMHGVLNGIFKILKSRFFNENQQLLDIIRTVNDFILNLSEENNFILTKAFKIVALGLSKVAGNGSVDIGFDMIPLFKKSFCLLKNVKLGVKTKISITYFLCNVLISFGNFVDFFVSNNLLEIFDQIIEQTKSDELIINCLKTCNNCTYFSVETNIKIIQSKFFIRVYDFIFSNNEQILIEALAIFQRLLNPDVLDFSNIIKLFEQFPGLFDSLAQIIKINNNDDILIYALSILDNSFIILNNTHGDRNIISFSNGKDDIIARIQQIRCSNNPKISKLSNLLYKLINC